jgi:hypothetical protein
MVMGSPAARLLACLMGTALACGGEARGPSRWTSGLEGDRTLADLSAGETAQLCKSAQLWAKDAIPAYKRSTLVCKTSSVTAAVLTGALGAPALLQASCQRTYDGCLRTTDMPPAAISCPTAGADCLATVAEFEACLNDFPLSFDETLAAIPACHELTLGAIARAGVDAMNFLPDSCAVYQARCPGARIAGLPSLP